MIAPIPELLAVLRQFDPWWREGRIVDLPDWRRAAFHEDHLRGGYPPGEWQASQHRANLLNLSQPA
jgi:hypothetical protein